MSSDYSYGYSSQGGSTGVPRSSNVNGIRAVPAGGSGYGGQQQQPAPLQHASPAGVQGIARVDRSSAINEYVAKQKIAKQNAPLIRKENQRVAEARAMSASRSKGGDSRDEYVDDYSNQGYDEPPLPAQQARNAASARPAMQQPPPQQAQSMGRAPPASSLGATADRRSAPVGAPPARSSVAPPGGRTVSYSEENSSNSTGYGVGPPSSSGSSSSVGGLGPSGSGPSNAELVKRVHLLEEQIRLLKQQNKIFLSFMQNTEQQLAELRAAPPALAAPPAAAASHRSNSRNGGYDASPAQQQQQPANSSAYPNNMSNTTKAGLQRAQSERPQMPGSSRSSAAPSQQQQQQPPPLNALGGQSDIDQTWAPPEDDAARKERLRSAKKKKELLNLRSKMKGGALPGAQQQAQQQQMEDDSRGGRYQADAYQDEYGGGGGGGYGAPPPQQQQQQRSAAPNQRGALQQQQQPQQYQQQQQQQPQRRAPPPPAASYYQDASPADDGPNDSFTGGGAGVPEGADEIVETYPCPNCDRRFNEVALAKHVAKQLCKQKPRKTFDMAAQRLEKLAQEAREAGIVLIPPKKGPGAAAAAAAASKPPTKKVSKWRADHEKFMAAIQAGKQMQAALDSGVPLSSIPAPITREEDDDRTPCPHCGRKFESGVAERHIPHCKNTKNKPKSNTASIARLGSTSTAAKRR